MRVLILGGTIFLGRHLVRAFLAHGHTVTLFNRGRQSYLAPDGVEQWRGDRDGDLTALTGGKWDAVVDTCGYFPRQVSATTRLLREQTPIYAYISSVNQYAGFDAPGTDEKAASDTTVVAPNAALTSDTYGPLKAACEVEVLKEFGGGALILRPGCMVGPEDKAHRFSYWVQRSAYSDPQLVPGQPNQLWQIIDVRDVTDWLVRMLEEARTGIYNVVGPNEPIDAQTFLAEMAAISGGHATAIWVKTEFLEKISGGKRWLDLAEWSHLPEKHAFLYSIDNARAVDAGLRFRPLHETINDVSNWLQQRSPRDSDAPDLDLERKILRQWNAGTPYQSSLGRLVRKLAWR